MCLRQINFKTSNNFFTGKSNNGCKKLSSIRSYEENFRVIYCPKNSKKIGAKSRYQVLSKYASAKKIVQFLSPEKIQVYELGEEVDVVTIDGQKVSSSGECYYFYSLDDAWNFFLVEVNWDLDIIYKKEFKILK